MQFSNIKTALTSFRYQKTCKTEKRYFKSGSLPNNCTIRDIFFREPFPKLYFTELNFICYNAVNDIRYLSDIDFND